MSSVIPLQTVRKAGQRQAILTPARSGLVQRKCACGGTPNVSDECEACRQKRQGLLQRRATGCEPDEVPPIVHEVLRSPGQPLDADTRAFMEPRFGHDFSQVQVHTDARGAESARAVNALAYTVGDNVVFGAGQYRPATEAGKRLIAHELTHALQQGPARSASSGVELGIEASPHEREAERIADAVVTGRTSATVNELCAPSVQRRTAPYIKKVTVHLNPLQSADLEWEGTAPSDAPGIDHFTVSTGKGYSNPGDPAGTCTRSCCSDAMTQCAPPWNQPGRVGACCTYHGSDFWTGVPENEHNGWKWWTPIQPYYSTRGIALHQHDEVTGQPIGHGCVRMEEPNAKRIHDFSNGRGTNVTIDGRAAPVACAAERQCGAASSSGSGAGAVLDTGSSPDGPLASNLEAAVPGLEGVLT